MFGFMKRRKVVAANTAPTDTAVAARSLFSTHANDGRPHNAGAADARELLGELTKYLSSWAPRPPAQIGTADDDDSDTNWNAIKSAYALSQPNIPNAMLQWFGTQTYIGSQMCAIVSQHWLVKKICLVPARDAIRHGFEIVNEVGEAELDSDILAEYAKWDKRLNLRKQMLNFAYNGRKFGIRVAFPVIDGVDDEFFEKPFNPDSIRPGSFKGWIMRDPYWMSPILSAEAAADMASPDFYEPTYWQLGKRRYHRSHLVIFRTEQPDDILKPTYLYGGIPVPQAIMEHVYAAERTAFEAPLLALTKRLYTLKVQDVESLMLNKDKFDQAMQFQLGTQDNFGVRIAGTDDEIGQLDTALTDLADVIEGQFAIACAAGDAPVNKIMGTTASGMSNEGGYDQESYRQTLESMQEHDITPLVERHHLLVKLSYVIPKFGKRGAANTTIAWNPLDAPTAKEHAEINKLNAETDLVLLQTGAISDADINERLRNNPDSGYSSIREIEEGERAAEFGNDPDPAIGTPSGPKAAPDDGSQPNAALTGDALDLIIAQSLREHTGR